MARTTTKRRGLSDRGSRYLSSDHGDEPLRIAKLFKNGRSQAVRLPKDCRFEGDEVYVKRQGRTVTLIPKEDPWRDMFDAARQFDWSIPFERNQPKMQRRESLDALFPPGRLRRTRSK
jgi:antitoxin VapB